MNDRRIEISDYLLGELSPEERAEAERRIREDPEYRAQVERMRPVVERLEELPREAWEAPQPPPLATPAPPAPKPARRPRALTLRPALAAAAAVALLAAGTAVGVLVAGDGTDGVAGGGETLALRPVGAEQAGTGTARLAGSGADGGGEAVVRVSDLPRSGSADYYELWLLNAPDDLISLGSFRVPESGNAEVRVPLPVDPRRFRFLDISVEPVSGGAGHSGRSVLRART